MPPDHRRCTEEDPLVVDLPDVWEELAHWALFPIFCGWVMKWLLTRTGFDSNSASMADGSSKLDCLQMMLLSCMNAMIKIYIDKDINASDDPMPKSMDQR